MNFTIHHKPQYKTYEMVGTGPIIMYDHTVSYFRFENGIQFSKSTREPQWLYDRDYYDLEDLIRILPEPESLEIIFNLEILIKI